MRLRRRAERAQCGCETSSSRLRGVLFGWTALLIATRGVTRNDRRRFARMQRRRYRGHGVDAVTNTPTSVMAVSPVTKMNPLPTRVASGRWLRVKDSPETERS